MGHSAAMVVIALLRGVNVGGHRKVPTAALRTVCEGLGFRAVRTYVQSGNLVALAPGSIQEAEALIERGLLEHFGFPVDVIATDAERWGALVAANPLAAEAERDPARTTLVLFKGPLAPDVAERLEARGRSGEIVRQAGGALYVHFPTGQGTSKLIAHIDREAGSPGTARNWNTVVALAELAAG